VGRVAIANLAFVVVLLPFALLWGMEDWVNQALIVLTSPGITVFRTLYGGLNGAPALETGKFIACVVLNAYLWGLVGLLARNCFIAVRTRGKQGHRTE